MPRYRSCAVASLARWVAFRCIERILFDLKEVLNLNRLYAANPNAVAMQISAAAIVYNAMRVAQSEAAAQLGQPPEDLPPAKLFPKIAVASPPEDSYRPVTPVIETTAAVINAAPATTTARRRRVSTPSGRACAGSRARSTRVPIRNRAGGVAT